MRKYDIRLSATKPLPEMKPVEVVLPVVKLRVDDLAYLRGLMSDGPKCRMSDGAKSRLRVLGLIEDKTLPPCPKEMRKFLQAEKQSKRLVLRAVKGDEINWDLLQKGQWARGRKPESRRVTVVTKAGEKLILKGTAKVQIQKGCK